jgi:hypothetical protein
MLTRIFYSPVKVTSMDQAICSLVIHLQVDHLQLIVDQLSKHAASTYQHKEDDPFIIIPEKLFHELCEDSKLGIRPFGFAQDRRWALGVGLLLNSHQDTKAQFPSP